MTGTLKHDEAAGFIVEYQHQLTSTTKQRKEIQLHPDDLDLISSFAPEEEVSFYIVENQKMSGTVQYAKLIRESHSDQVIDIMNDESTILGKKIVEYADKYKGTDKYNVAMLAIEFGYHLQTVEDQSVDVNNMVTDEEIEDFISSFPYTKHLDDGQYNDGVISGIEIGIEWYRKQNKESSFVSYNHIFDKAKEMHEQEVMDFVYKAVRKILDEERENPFNLEQYYNETFKKD